MKSALRSINIAFGLMLAVILTVTLTILLPRSSLAASLYEDGFDNFSAWQATGATQPESFYCHYGNCVKLTSDGNNGYLTKTFSNLEIGATYRAKAYGAVHNVAEVDYPATVEIGIADSFSRVATQCGSSSRDLNCLGGGNPAGVFKEISISKKTTSPTISVTIKGWAGECNNFGCSEAFIDDFNLDLITPASGNSDDDNGSNSPTPTLTPTPTPTVVVRTFSCPAGYTYVSRAGIIPYCARPTSITPTPTGAFTLTPTPTVTIQPRSCPAGYTYVNRAGIIPYCARSATTTPTPPATFRNPCPSGYIYTSGSGLIPYCAINRTATPTPIR